MVILLAAPVATMAIVLGVALRVKPLISDCTTRRGQALFPEHDAAERETAEANGAVFASLTENVCPYDPCPVVSESTLMWRNESHLTATFAQQLWPAMRDIVRDALERPVPDDAEAAAGEVPGE